jgi:hypothetical protein
MAFKSSRNLMCYIILVVKLDKLEFYFENQIFVNLIKIMQVNSFPKGNGLPFGMVSY